VASAEPVRRYVVGIGVGDYDLEELRLPKASGDVGKITDWFALHPRVAHERALPALGRNPTWEAMQAGLRGWLKERRPSDVIVLYIAAHGDYEAGRAYLFGRNTPRRQLAGAALEAQTLGAMLGQFSAHNVLVIIDACVAGKLATQIQRAAEDAADASNTREPQRAWAQVLLCSTFGRDPALDGLFAQAFIDVVNNEKWTGTTREWIDIDQLMRGINEELRQIKSPQVAERKVWGPSPAELIPNPNFAARELGALVAEEELATHFDPSARGASRSESGSFFSGRVAELRRIVAWLGSADANVADGSLMVITGSPGSGKSALLSRVVLLGDPALRGRAGDLSALPAGSLPPPGAFGAVVWCRHKSLRQVVGEIGRAIGRTLADAPALLDAARERGTTLAVDALDESLPGEVVAIAQCLAGLAALPGWRVLVATRRHPVRGGELRFDLLDSLAADAAHTLTLDQSADRAADMRAYVRARLAAGAGAAAAAYRVDPALAARVAERVEAAAGTSFLVAAVTARTLAASDTPADPAALRLPSAVGDAMAAYIERLPDPARVRAMLRPLAWAQGAGLPWGELWPRLAAALAEPGAAAGDADVRAALDAAADLIVESVEHGGPVYRLFHEQLAEHLRRDTPPAQAHAAIARVLLETTRGRPWSDVHPYVVANLSAHLAHAHGMTDTLVRLALDPLWERARRTLAPGATAWLDDVELALQALAATSPGDLRQVGLCVVSARKFESAPVQWLAVIARAGQLQRAERMSNNLAEPLERVRAFSLLARLHHLVADPEASQRCLRAAVAAADSSRDLDAVMARGRIAKAFLDCGQRAAAVLAARAALQAALALDMRPPTRQTPWRAANGLRAAARALRDVEDDESIAALCARRELFDPARPLTLQLAGILRDAPSLAAAFAVLKTTPSGAVRAGPLAEALAEAGMEVELDELLRWLEHAPGRPMGKPVTRKGVARALAIVGRLDEAVELLWTIVDRGIRIETASAVASSAERRGGRAALERLAELLLADSAPRDAARDAMAAQVLSIAGRHDVALAIAETAIRHPRLRGAQAEAGEGAVPRDDGAQRPLAAIDRLLRAGRVDDALREALALGRPGEGAAAAATPADRALALARVAARMRDRARALGAWLEAVRTAGLAGPAILERVLQRGERIVGPANAGRTWASLVEELADLVRHWEIESFVEQYDGLRAAFGSGPQRTSRMNSLMLVPRRQAAQWTPAHVARALADGTPARRVFVIGLMQVDRKLLLPGLLIETIGHSASAFEQYQALKLMAEHLQQLDARQRAELARVLASELADDGSGRGQIGVDSSRRALAEQMLAQLLAAAGKP